MIRNNLEVRANLTCPAPLYSDLFTYFGVHRC